jgi:single-stranded-DNA-specific exonuclease
MQQSWTLPATTPPPEFRQLVETLVPGNSAYIAQLLWQRSIHDRLPGFLNAQNYQPHGPEAFGEEISWAIDRLKQARSVSEKVAIWGDFDADGVTATAVLWDGLGQFFTQNNQLTYYIPNRLTESHGLSIVGLDYLHQQGYTLIVTCDTGSTNFIEIAYAESLGIEIIVTDHHTLPEIRPDVVAIVNPRYLKSDHPFATLSGVAVAYKLVEGLYLALPDVPTKPLSHLLDLVAIGLIADLVELKGDCRYLAQIGIAQLQTQSKPETMTRPGVAKLLALCKRSGDRPTDISFGIGPRINAVSRIQGDAHFCVELLTSQDVALCDRLAIETELANTRRKALQQDVYQQALRQVTTLDLSTTDVLVLWDAQWHPGVLGLVASQLAQEYGRPAILLSVDGLIARGSARSVRQIDLYQLVKAQAHLLDRFGGHPFAAGMSLPAANLPIFAAAVNQQLRRQLVDIDLSIEVINADLVVTVADLGIDLYKQIKLLEPCGMGNPAPKLWIKDCWFEQARQRNIKDYKGNKLRYIKTEFELCDATESGFVGVWWGHYSTELPSGKCDVLVELDNNTFSKRYEVRLIAVRSLNLNHDQPPLMRPIDWLWDCRGQNDYVNDDRTLVMSQAPHSEVELQAWFQRARQDNLILAIAYKPLVFPDIETVWQEWIGIAKYLSRTKAIVTPAQIQQRLGWSDRVLEMGLDALNTIGFTVRSQAEGFQVQNSAVMNDPSNAMTEFTIALQEEQFRQQYFAQMPFATICAIAGRSAERSP